MKKIIYVAIFSAITLVASAAQAVVQAVVKPEPPIRRTTGACFWEVPGVVKIVNLYALQTAYTALDGDHYITRFIFGYSGNFEIPIPKGAALTIYIDQVKARIDACAGPT